MGWISAAAIFFIIWWTVLFVALPFGLRTQDENDDVTLGTVASAPGRPHMLKAFIRTTIAAICVFAAFYYVTVIAGYGFDDIPSFLPEMK